VAAVAAAPQQLDYAAITEAQRDCPSIPAAGDTNLNLQLVPFGPIRVLCDTKWRHPRPIISLGHRRQVFDAFHSMAHPGAKATTAGHGGGSGRAPQQLDYAAIFEAQRDCPSIPAAGNTIRVLCDTKRRHPRPVIPLVRQVTQQPAAAVQPIPVPRQRFSHIHVDIVGPLPVSREGFRYLFTIIDRSSRLLEAVLLTNVETTTCRDALVRHWISRFGLPAHLTSDQGTQFTSALWARTAPSSAPTTTPPRPTTPRATGWWRGPTGG
jgi:Integrase core domain